ncbi:MAG: hypothetical protein AAB288_01130, partial [Acidobacteriota bacterium]
AYPNDPTPGTRVHVFNADQTRDLGLGTYLGRVSVTDAVVDAGPEWMGVTTPEIELDTGEKVYGFQCWWSDSVQSV